MTAELAATQEGVREARLLRGDLQRAERGQVFLQQQLGAKNR